MEGQSTVSLSKPRADYSFTPPAWRHAEKNLLAHEWVVYAESPLVGRPRCWTNWRAISTVIFGLTPVLFQPGAEKVRGRHWKSALPIFRNVNAIALESGVFGKASGGLAPRVRSGVRIAQG